MNGLLVVLLLWAAMIASYMLTKHACPDGDGDFAAVCATTGSLATSTSCVAIVVVGVMAIARAARR